MLPDINILHKDITFAEISYLIFLQVPLWRTKRKVFPEKCRDKLLDHFMKLSFFICYLVLQFYICLTLWTDT